MSKFYINCDAINDTDTPIPARYSFNGSRALMQNPSGYKVHIERGDFSVANIPILDLSKMSLWITIDKNGTIEKHNVGSSIADGFGTDSEVFNIQNVIDNINDGLQTLFSTDGIDAGSQKLFMFYNAPISAFECHVKKGVVIPSTHKLYFSTDMYKLFRSFNYKRMSKAHAAANADQDYQFLLYGVNDYLDQYPEKVYIGTSITYAVITQSSSSLAEWTSIRKIQLVTNLPVNPEYTTALSATNQIGSAQILTDFAIPRQASDHIVYIPNSPRYITLQNSAPLFGFTLAVQVQMKDLSVKELLLEPKSTFGIKLCFTQLE